MLRREGPGGQRLREGLFEERLAERPAELRRLQEVLEPRHVAREALDLLRGLEQPPELLADLLQQGAGAAEMLGDRALAGVEPVLDAADARLDGAAKLVEPAIDRLRRLARPRRLGEQPVEARGRLARPGEDQQDGGGPDGRGHEGDPDEDGRRAHGYSVEGPRDK